MTVWGYARVSTVDQDTTPQFAALKRAGIDDEHIVVDHVSGARQDRPGLNEVLHQLEDGDVLTVWKLDRLGRSLSHLVSVVHELGERGVEFRSLTESVDTTGPSGRLLFHLVAAVAEFERDLVSEHTRAALEVARSRNRQIGRPSKVNRHQYDLILQMHTAGATQSVIAATTGLSRAVIGRVVRGEINSLARFNTAAADDEELPLYSPVSEEP